MFKLISSVMQKIEQNLFYVAQQDTVCHFGITESNHTKKMALNCVRGFAIIKTVHLFPIANLAVSYYALRLLVELDRH